MTDGTSVESITLTTEQSEQIKDLERRLAEGDPTLKVLMFTELEERYGK